MIWYDVIYDMIWYDIIWYDIWCDVIWYDIYDIIWYDIWYNMIWYDMIYLITAIGLTPCGSSTVHIYTQTTHRKHKNLGRVWAVPRLCELYPDICLTTEEKARKNLSQGSRRVPVGTMVFIMHVRWIAANTTRVG